MSLPNSHVEVLAPSTSEGDCIWRQVVAQVVKSLPAMQETMVQFLGQEDPLEKEMATHSSILAWKIPLMEEPGGLQSVGCKSWTCLSS